MRGLAGLAALLLHVSAFAGAAPAWREPSAPRPTTGYEQATFRLAVPAGWKRTEQADCVKDPAISRDWCYGLARFESGEGAFFQVLVDYPPTEASANAYWDLSPSLDEAAVLVVREGRLRACPLTLDGEARCNPRRGFSIAAWIELRGHHYLFGFGHTRGRKGVDLAVFREILRSFRAR